MIVRLAVLALVMCMGPGCSDDPVPVDAAPPDPTDAQPADAAMPDASAGLPLAGFGGLEGTCGTIDSAALTSPEPQLLHNALDFANMPYNDGLLAELSAGGQEIYNDGNAGGSSIYSEMFAHEVLHRCELAQLLKTENEIIYDTQGKITDFLVEIQEHKVGVSVTRAFRFPPGDPYTEAHADELLRDKLADVQESSANVAAEDAWVKQILHILAYEPMHAASLEAAYDALEPAVRADTIVVVTVTHGQDDFMY